MDFLKFLMKKFYSMWVEVIALSLAVIFISFLFYRQLTNFRSFDPKISLNEYIPQVEGTVSRLPVLVETGMLIKNFTNFDVIANEFEMEAIVWFQFNPNLISLDTIGAFSFDMGTAIKESPIVKVVGEKLYAEYLVRVKFQTRLDYRLFPFDDHRITVILKNEAVSPMEMRYISRGFWLRTIPFLYTADWKLVGSGVEIGESSRILDDNSLSDKSSYPAVVFSLDFVQMGIRRSLVLFLPIFLIFLLGLLSLLIILEKERRVNLSISAGSVSGLVILRFVIEGMSPRIGYFTTIDIIYVGALVGSFSIYFIETFCFFWLQSMAESETRIEMLSVRLKRVNVLRRWLFLVLLMIFVGGVYFAFYFD